jgi:hypothetical protein
MQRGLATLAVVGLAIIALAAAPTTVRAADATRTLVIGDRGRDGETGHTLRLESGGSWSEMPARSCGPLGLDPATNVEYGLRLQFPLGALPAGAVVTGATLALHDASPAGAITLAGYVGAPLIGGDGPPDHTTGAIEIVPGPAAARQTWNVTTVFAEEMVAFGWAGFWLRPVTGAVGLHDIDCPRDALFPVLTLRYARGAAPTPAPGTLVVGVGAEGGGMQRVGEGPWASLTDSLCGDVGWQRDADLEGRISLTFPLDGLPDGARITHAALALRDAYPTAGGPVVVVAYDPFDP